MIVKFIMPIAKETGNSKIFPIMPIAIIAGIFEKISLKGSFIIRAKVFPKKIIAIQLNTETANKAKLL